jgi:hypothetical protein
MAIRVEQAPLIFESDGSTFVGNGHLTVVQAPLIFESDGSTFVGSGHITVVQGFLVFEMAVGSVADSPPTRFELQKLVLSVKESNVPSRGRNQ